LIFGLSVFPDGYNIGDQFTYSGGTNPSSFNGTYTVAEIGFFQDVGLWVIGVNTDSTESASSEGGFITKVN
jgi:hypothetical protein